jgi:hypothetical protein
VRTPVELLRVTSWVGKLPLLVEKDRGTVDMLGVSDPVPPPAPFTFIVTEMLSAEPMAGVIVTVPRQLAVESPAALRVIVRVVVEVELMMELASPAVSQLPPQLGALTEGGVISCTGFALVVEMVTFWEV